MGNYTKKQRDGQEQIKKAIVDAHRRGKCDKNGNPIPPRVYGNGHLPWTTCNWGERKLNIWPRDEDGNLIED